MDSMKSARNDEILQITIAHARNTADKTPDCKSQSLARER
jgi:hypothetical protein